MTPAGPILTLRYGLGSRVSAAAIILLFAIAAWFVPSYFEESAVRGGAMVFAFVYFIGWGLPEALGIISYRFDVFETHLAVRPRPWRTLTVPIAAITDFVEDTYTGSGMFHWEVLRFRFIAPGHPVIDLTAAVPGWAAAIGAVHELAPDAVPKADTLMARLAPKFRKWAKYAHLVPAPGQDIPEERSWRKRVTNRDGLRGFGLAALIVLPIWIGGALFAILVLGWREDLVRTASSFTGPAITILLGIELTNRFRRRRIDKSGGWETGYDEDWELSLHRGTPLPGAATVSAARPGVRLEEVRDANPVRGQDEGTWAVMRQDDNGYAVLVRGGMSQEEAEALAAEMEALGHKQLYWVEREDG